MGIYIKGMEMPTSCYNCPFLDYEEGFCFASGVKHESSLGGWYESTLCPGGIKDKRHEECPLVPVLPHGRLIDADALKTTIIETLEKLKANPKMDGQEMHLVAAFHTLGVMLDDMQTIIEAEEESDG